MQDIQIGNQQERLYGWLAGILDGEGSLTVACHKLPGNRIRLTPMIAIANTNLEILRMAKTIIHKILESKPGYVSKLMYRDKGTNNPVYQLRVDGYKSVNSVLIHMREYMVGKQKNADAVLAFIKARDGNRFSRNSAGQIRRTRYSKKEVKLFDQVRKLNHRESPEAIRQASNVIR